MILFFSSFFSVQTQRVGAYKVDIRVQTSGLHPLGTEARKRGPKGVDADGVETVRIVFRTEYCKFNTKKTKETGAQ